jgi:transcriptional regulator with XRE-family HTH domain
MPRKLTGFLPLQCAEPKEATAAAVSAILKAIRRRLNVSQERLAHQAGVDRTYVAKVERAIFNPTIYRINRVLRAAGVPWREFGEALDAALNAEPATHSRHTRRAP